MSPNSNKEIYLTEVERDLMAIFVKYKILNDKYNTVILRQLADKLEGQYAKDSGD